MIKIRFTGIKVLTNKLERASKRLNDIHSNVKEEAEYIKNNAKAKAPVAKYNGGTLKDSAYINDITVGNSIGYKVGFDATNKRGRLYGPYQEFGTLNEFKLNSEYKEFDNFALNYKIYGPLQNRNGVKPRRYFLHYYIIARKRLSRKTKTIVKNIMK